MSVQASSVQRTAPVHSTGYLVRNLWRKMVDYLALVVLGLFFMFPIVFMLVTSIKTNEDQVLHDISGLQAFVPYGQVGVQNYSNVFQETAFGRYMFNSVLIVGLIVILGLFFNSMAAYALARLRWKGRRLVLSIVIALIIIPFEAVAIPLLLEVNSFGWIDSYHVQIIPFISDAFSIFLFYQFFIGLPKDLEEAARVDGAGYFRIYWNIVVPLSRPVFATVAILQFLLHWGDYLWPLMVTRGIEHRPLMIGMQQFFGQYPRIWGNIMAFASMITIPVLIVFLLFQKWFVQSVASSGVKG